MTTETSPNDNGYLDILNDDEFWSMLLNRAPYDGTLKEGSAVSAPLAVPFVSKMPE
jgi:hypothetical protein